MKRPALQNERVGVLRTAFQARKVFGTFEKRTTGPFVLWSLLHIGKCFAISWLQLILNNVNVKREKILHSIAHCCLLWAIESWPFIAQSVDLTEMIIKYFNIFSSLFTKLPLSYSTRGRDFLVTIPSAFTSRYLRLPNSNESKKSKNIFPPMIEIPCLHRFCAKLVTRDTMVSQSKSIFLYHQDLRDPKLRPLYRLTESSCFLFCLSPSINYEKKSDTWSYFQSKANGIKSQHHNRSN